MASLLNRLFQAPQKNSKGIGQSSPVASILPGNDSTNKLSKPWPNYEDENETLVMDCGNGSGIRWAVAIESDRKRGHSFSVRALRSLHLLLCLHAPALAQKLGG